MRAGRRLGAGTSTPLRRQRVSGSVSIKEAAQLLGVSRQRVQQMVGDGKLPAHRLPGSSVWLIDESGVLERLQKGGGRPPSRGRVARRKRHDDVDPLTPVTRRRRMTAAVRELEPGGTSMVGADTDLADATPEEAWGEVRRLRKEIRVLLGKLDGILDLLEE